jgi:hypothetical protein
MLMSTHPITAHNDGKSQFRVDVEKAAGPKATDWRQALINTANANFKLNLAATDLPTALPPNFTAQQLRYSLDIEADMYDPNMGPCPDGTTEVGTGKHLDHQLAIARAILAVQGPVV